MTMLLFFERLVDPYVDYSQTDTLPQRLWPFMMNYSQPFKRVFWATGIMSIVVAVVEIWLIAYMGRVVDILQGDPALVWETYGREFFYVALFILFVRPVLQFIDVALLNNTILPNLGTLIRWRAQTCVAPVGGMV
jgi:ATP-binding cassette subfamily B multidrug efflux pump